MSKLLFLYQNCTVESLKHGFKTLLACSFPEGICCPSKLNDKILMMVVKDSMVKVRLDIGTYTTWLRKEKKHWVWVKMTASLR